MKPTTIALFAFLGVGIYLLTKKGQAAPANQFSNAYGRYTVNPDGTLTTVRTPAEQLAYDRVALSQQ